MADKYSSNILDPFPSSPEVFALLKWIEIPGTKLTKLLPVQPKQINFNQSSNLDRQVATPAVPSVVPASPAPQLSSLDFQAFGEGRFERISVGSIGQSV